MNEMQKLNFAEYILSGMPVEWAYLLAERSTNAAVHGRSPSDHLYLAFVWDDYPEGFAFWYGVRLAFASEEEAS